MILLAWARRSVAPVLALPWVPKSLIGLATFLAVVGIATLDYVPQRLNIQVGEPAQRDIEAPRTVDYIDPVQTAIRRRIAAGRIEPVYRESADATAAARTAVTTAFDAATRLRTAAKLTDAERVLRLQRQAGVPLAPEEAAAALQLDAAVSARARAATLEAVEQVMGAGVRPEALEEGRMQVRDLLRGAGLSGRALAVASAVGQSAIRANLILDRAATQALRGEAEQAVEPVRVRILRGEIIVRRGDRMTETHLRKLEALGLIGVPLNWGILAGLALLVAGLLGLTAYYTKQFLPEIWRQNRLILLWSITVVLTVLLARAVVSYRMPLNLIPAAVGPILLAVLLRPRLALFTAAVLSILIALIATGDLRTAFIAFTGSLVGIYAIRRISRRTDLIAAGLKAGLATAAAIIAIHLLEGQPLYPAMLMDAAIGVLNGIGVGFVASGLLPSLEHLFGLVTPIKLLELSNPAHPLLRRLQMEAPGTYHHSVLVGNLAEAAAEAIGADPLLARVGTYYHDVGKIRRPALFVENQFGADNPHDRMSPSLSALAVEAHVRDGLDLAREYGLPKVVTDFIAEHHGTSLMSYFYHHAVERGDRPEPGAYRYPGPKPQTRETAIVMLADAVEAAVRTLPRPTPDRVYEVVRRIIHERLEDGQLDECDLMFRDLEQIAQAFTRILTGILHPRVEYPELERDLRAAGRERVGRPR